MSPPVPQQHSKARAIRRHSGKPWGGGARTGLDSTVLGAGRGKWERKSEQREKGDDKTEVDNQPKEAANRTPIGETPLILLVPL